MIVKICGLSDPESIRETAVLHPDMMGFIFYQPSPRHACGLLPETISGLPAGIDRVGVFVDAGITHILSIAARYGLTSVQLHGKETPHTCRLLRESGLRVMKAIGVRTGIDWTHTALYEGSVDMLVLDTFSAAHGGSGRKFDWNLLHDDPLTTPFLLSGGISPDDAAAVKTAMASLPRMAGIDINSRFERAPGAKDLHLIKHFLSEL